MLVSNLQISKTLKYVPIVLYSIVLLDLLLIFVPDLFGGVRINGYLATAIIVGAVAFYSYMGYPLFTFDAKTEVIKIRSHLALSTIFGKELSVQRDNITSLEINLEGIRKYLVVTYIRGGKEVSEKFSITILSDRKLKRLENAVEDIKLEKSARNFHLFI